MEPAYVIEVMEIFFPDSHKMQLPKLDTKAEDYESKSK